MPSVRFEPVRPSLEQLKAIAASGAPGAVAARKALQARVHELLKRAVH